MIFITKSLTSKLIGVINILRGRPTMYRINFVKPKDPHIMAIKNHNARILETNYLRIDASEYEHRIISNGVVVHDPGGNVFFGDKIKPSDEGILMNPKDRTKVTWVEVNGKRQWWNPKTQNWQKEKP